MEMVMSEYEDTENKAVEEGASRWVQSRCCRSKYRSWLHAHPLVILSHELITNLCTRWQSRSADQMHVH